MAETDADRLAALMKTHYGDPCIHCGLPHDEVAPGPCTGDGAPIVVAYRIDRQAWQTSNGADLVLCWMSDGSLRQEGHYPQEHWAFTDRFRNARVIGRAKL